MKRCMSGCVCCSFDHFLLDGDNDIIGSLPTFESVRITIYRGKQKQQTKLPGDTADIALEGIYTQTIDDRAFLLSDITISAGCNHCFSTDEALTHFLQAEKVFTARTFFFSCATLFASWSK